MTKGFIKYQGKNYSCDTLEEAILIANIKPLPEDEAEIRAAEEATQYQRDRASEYPSIQAQLDELYHNGIDGWKTTIKSIKDKYPKGVTL